MITKVSEGHYVISSDQVAIPGVYASTRAAIYAYRFGDTDLQVLQDEINGRESDFEKRVITFENLQDLRKRLRK